MYPTSYKEALALSKTRKRKLDYNTYLEPDYNDENIGIRLHKTVVVEFFKDGSVELNTGGWKTTATRDRMSKAGIHVYQRLGEWYIITIRGIFRYQDGMTIDKKGYCNTPKADIDEDRKAYRREKYRQNRERYRMIRLRKTPLYQVMLGLSKLVNGEHTGIINQKAKIDSAIDKYNPKLPIYKPR